MSQIIMPKDQGLEVADIFREHIADYQQTYTLAPSYLTYFGLTKIIGFGLKK